ncbi:hypothetical protein V2G26_014879 [Clonostachys chloroleuca]
MEHLSRDGEASAGPSAVDREPTRAARSNNWRARDSISPPRDDSYNSRNSGNDRRTRNDYNQERQGDGGYRSNRRDYGRRNDWGFRQEDGASFRSSNNAAQGSDAIAEGRRIYEGISSISFAQNKSRRRLRRKALPTLIRSTYPSIR